MLMATGDWSTSALLMLLLSRSWLQLCAAQAAVQIRRLQAQIARSTGCLFRRTTGRLWARGGSRL